MKDGIIKDPRDVDIDDSEWFALADEAPPGPDLPRRQLTEEEIEAALARLFPEGADKGSEESGHWGHRGRPGQRGGSMPGGVYLAIDKKLRRAVRDGARECMEYGLETGFEAAVAYDQNGEKINGTCYGDEQSCDIEPIMQVAYEDWDSPDNFDMAVPISVGVHNHPTSPLPPSGHDVAQLVNHEMDHIVVVTDYGYAYRLSRTENTPPGVSGDKLQAHMTEIQAAYLAMPEVQAMVIIQGWPVTELQVQHQTMKVIAEEGAMDYSWENPPGGALPDPPWLDAYREEGGEL